MEDWIDRSNDNSSTGAISPFKTMHGLALGPDAVHPGFLTKKSGDYRPPAGSRGRRGIKLAQLAIAWLAGNPIVGSVIAGATSAEQVVQKRGGG
jgi:hypothetical protein